MTSVPPLSESQRQQARAAAAQVRRHRAAAKARLRTGDLHLSAFLDLAENDDVLAHIKVVDLLRSLPRVGDKRAADTMERLDIAPSRRIRGLGRHQLAALREEFR